jgi:hypothetical protein
MAETALRIVRGTDPINPPTYVGQNENRPSRNFEPDADTGWRMRSNREFEWVIDGHPEKYRSNRQGFRSDRDFDHPSGMLIGAVGDSFTWGTGVAYGETFGHLIEKHFEGATVYNFAMPGFGIDQMWMSVRHQILPLHPSLVVVAFIGIYVASAIYIAVFMIVLGKYPAMKSVVLAVIVNVVFFMMFEVWFKVPLYKGMLEPLRFLGY